MIESNVIMNVIKSYAPALSVLQAIGKKMNNISDEEVGRPNKLQIMRSGKKRRERGYKEQNRFLSQRMER